MPVGPLSCSLALSDLSPTPAVGRRLPGGVGKEAPLVLTLWSGVDHHHRTVRWRSTAALAGVSLSLGTLEDQSVKSHSATSEVLSVTPIGAPVIAILGDGPGGVDAGRRKRSCKGDPLTIR